MSEPIAPSARTLLEGGDAASRSVPCSICGERAPLPDFVWESVKLWNRQELEMAEREHRKADFIRTDELGMTCDLPRPCRAELFRRKHAESEAENATTVAYLGMLQAGRYNPESLSWLRGHGMAAHVARLLAKEGTAKAHG